MGVSVVFEDDSNTVEVVPGEAATRVVRVENTGMVVDRVLLDVLGDAAGWAQAEPAQANLLPGATERVRITFRPPRVASQTPGEVRFGLRAMSTEDPEGSCIEEGSVRVAEFGDLGAQLVPRSSTGRRSARFKLVVENRGNRPEQIRVEALDPEDRLGFRPRPATFVAQPGTATFIRLKTVPRKTFVKGPNRTLPFEVSALPERGKAAKAEGVMLEKQTLPEWLLPLLGIAVVACGLLVALWFAVVKPVHSAATDAAQAQNAAGSAQSAAAALASEASKPKPSTAPATPTSLVVKLASPTVVTGTTVPATVTGTFAQGTGAVPKVVWTSSAPDVALVAQDGTVTGLSPGTATITATGVTATASPAATAAASPAPTTSPGPVAPPVPAGSIQVTVVGPVSVSTAALPAAALGKPYSQALTATGGTGSYTWSLSSGTLPPGLSLSRDAGAITGTPTAAGKTSLTLHLADATSPGLFATKVLELTVVNALAVDSSALPAATTGAFYSQTLTGARGTAPYHWSLAPGQGALPDGLRLDPATGTVSGVPVSAGSSDLTVQVTDSARPSQTATQHLTVTVAKPLSISTLALPDAVAGTQYAQKLNASGGTEPYTWSVDSGTLPTGLTLSASGMLSGTPQTAGSSTFTVRTTDAAKPERTAPQAFTVRVVTSLAITTSSMPQAAIGQCYTDGMVTPPPAQCPTGGTVPPPSPKLTAAGGTGPYVWTRLGTLPPGLDLATDGTVSGTPTTTGSFHFTVRATDSSSPPQTSTQSLTVTVVGSLRITTVALPNALTGHKYAQSLVATGGSGGPYTWSVASGTLPDGLTLDPAGNISGIATKSGKVQLGFSAKDSGPPEQIAAMTVWLNVVDPLSFEMSAPPNAALGATYPGATPTRPSGGTGPFVWSITDGGLPAGLLLNTTTGAITGTVQAPATAGTFEFTLTVKDTADDTLTASTHLAIVVVNPLRASASFQVSATAGTPIQPTPQTTIQPLGGEGPYSYAMDSAIPGISIDPATGVLSGTPGGPCQDPDSTEEPTSGSVHTVRTTCTTPDLLTANVTIKDALGESVTRPLKLTVTVPDLVVAFNADTPTQTAGSALTVTAPHPSGGYGSRTYTYAAPELPCDSEDKTLCDRIDSTGRVSGTLDHLDDATKTFTVTVTSTDPVTKNTMTAHYQESITTVSKPRPTGGGPR